MRDTELFGLFIFYDVFKENKRNFILLYDKPFNKWFFDIALDRTIVLSQMQNPNTPEDMHPGFMARTLNLVF